MSSWWQHRSLPQGREPWGTYIQGPPLADAHQPPGSPLYPDRASSPRRAAPSAYAAITFQNPIPPTYVTSNVVLPDYIPKPRRAGAQAYDGSNTPPTEDGAPSLITSPVHFPDVARAYRRAPNTAYAGLTSAPVTPADVDPPPGNNDATARSIYPTQYAGYRRAAPSAYAGLLSPMAESDHLQPQTIIFPAYPDRPIGVRRAASTAYQITASPQIGDKAMPPAAVFPDRAAVKPRTAAWVQQSIVTPQMGDGPSPASPGFPDRARGPLRAANTAYVASWGNSDSQLPVPLAAGTAVFPSTAPGPKRQVNTVYAGLLSAPRIPDAFMPSGSPVFPATAPGARRASFQAYTAIVAPAQPDKIAPPGTAVFPSTAPGYKRASATAYAALVSPQAQPDAPMPSGSVVASMPRRLPLRAPDAVYQVSTSQTSGIDKTMPAGSPVFPERAAGPRRAATQAYVTNTKPQIADVWNLSVATGLKVTPLADLGTVRYLTVGDGFKLTPAIVPSLGRFRSGDTVTLGFTVTGTATVAPTVKILNEAGDVVATLPLWTWDGVTFQTNLVIGPQYGVGTFTAESVLTNSQGTVLALQQFTVAAGGDPGSSVISIHAAEVAHGRFTIVQLASGRLVMGREPYAGG